MYLSPWNKSSVSKCLLKRLSSNLLMPGAKHLYTSCLFELYVCTAYSPIVVIQEDCCSCLLNCIINNHETGELSNRLLDDMQSLSYQQFCYNNYYIYVLFHLIIKKTFRVEKFAFCLSVAEILEYHQASIYTRDP